MPRIPQGRAQKGSQKWIQKVINENPELINSRIRTQLDLPGTENVSWYSPLAEDEFAEYQDQAFLDLLDIKLPKVSLSHFWPLRGPVWDGLDKFKTGEIFSADFISRLF